MLADLQSPEKGSVDGMKVDEQGNIYSTGPGGVWVISKSGEHLGTIVAPEIPANCGWGDADYRTLYLTAPKSVYRVRANVRGKRLSRPPRSDITAGDQQTCDSYFLYSY
jgi:gluconolactonase